MNAILIIAAWLSAIAGLLFMSKVTAGIGGLCFACFLAIVYRINQAEAHHKRMIG